MAFPYTAEHNFEAGASTFDSTTGNNIAVLSFRRLAAENALNLMPYRGAYAVRVDLAGASSTEYIQENDDFDIAADGTLYIRFVFAVTTDLVMAASDRFTIFALQSSGNTDEVVVDIRNNAGAIEVLAAETGSATTLRSDSLVLGKWHTAEIFANIDNVGNNDGTIDFWLDGTQVGAQITGLDQGAIAQARLGAMGIDAGTTTGRVLFSEITADDARLFPYSSRFANPRVITLSQHLFVGPGYVDRAAFLSTASDNVLKLYDTNTANVNDDQGPLLELDPDANVSWSTPIRFEKGCYVELSGTSPRALVGWAETHQNCEVFGPLTLEDGSLRAWARGG